MLCHWKINETATKPPPYANVCILNLASFKNDIGVDNEQRELTANAWMVARYFFARSSMPEFNVRPHIYNTGQHMLTMTTTF